MPMPLTNLRRCGPRMKWREQPLTVRFMRFPISGTSVTSSDWILMLILRRNLTLKMDRHLPWKILTLSFGLPMKHIPTVMLWFRKVLTVSQAHGPGTDLAMKNSLVFFLSRDRWQKFRTCLTPRISENFAHGHVPGIQMVWLCRIS